MWLRCGAGNGWLKCFLMDSNPRQKAKGGGGNRPSPSLLLEIATMVRADSEGVTRKCEIYSVPYAMKFWKRMWA